MWCGASRATPTLWSFSSDESRTKASLVSVMSGKHPASHQCISQNNMSCTDAGAFFLTLSTFKTTFSVQVSSALMWDGLTRMCKSPERGLKTMLMSNNFFPLHQEASDYWSYLFFSHINIQFSSAENKNVPQAEPTSSARTNCTDTSAESK